MKTLTIQISDEEHKRLAKLADVLNLTPEEFLSREGIDILMSGLEFSVSENLAARIWDTLEEAKEAATKADALDESAYDWHFYRQADGRILSEPGSEYREKIEASGGELILSGESLDWSL